jgi:TatA/E family protein of Tat protein translocase
MMGLGFQEILLLLLIALLLFGSKKLPEVGRSLGKAIREFKDAMDGKETGSSEKPKDGNTNNEPK